ncbi:hypothetical protein CHS0354_002486 [Potamilus streckersoni]|uniref:Uncharacterized protein n=1 Tax=Potamilus streckersoni TaxID=2493646 RepID=A0AAE0WA40_9BIVA|nr:hypothetical protein CHS0354_002486 [Potamilus streckersoni]
MRANFSLVVILMCVYAAKAEITEASLDEESVCAGNPFEIKEGNQLRLFSEGMLKTSMCSVRMNVQRSQTCRGVCFNLTSSNFADCSARFFTIETFFGELVPEVIKEKNCKESMEVPWCSSAHTLNLHLLVDTMVKTPKFNFSATVYPRCGDDVVYKAPSTDLEESVSMSLLYGALVAICLCLVFLIVCLVACCHYKNNNIENSKSPLASKEKALKIPGEGRKQSSSADPKYTYVTINGMEKDVNLLIAAGAKS